VVLTKGYIIILLEFSIIDEGIGISVEDQKRLFRFFSQSDSSTTRQFEGTGLGLAISKSIVELMGGEIWVESVEGVGATFVFRVRMQKSDEKSVELERAKQLNKEKPTQDNLTGVTILLVEDNLTNQEIAVDILESMGLHCDTANNGQEAVDMVKKILKDMDWC